MTMRGNRPDFSLEMSPQEFGYHYWYKEDLVKICSCHRLPTTGTKAELAERIERRLNGEFPQVARRGAILRRRSTEPKEITLATRLIPDGFKFNIQAREFFARHFNRPKFSFTKEMAAAVRDAERCNDLNMTVADLIDVYEGKVQPANAAEERTYQWNRFVKDFNLDERSARFGKERMRVAAELWKRVRDGKGVKAYTPSLLSEYLETAPVECGTGDHHESPHS